MEAADKNERMKRWVVRIIVFAVLVGLIMMARHFTGQTGQESNAESRAIAKYLEDSVAEHFPINRKDVFWTMTINLLLRKAAHFTQFMLIGAALCTLVNVLTRRVWVAFAVSAVGSFALAYLDEYRQNFVDDRNPQWLDVRIDSYGALTGIILTSLFFFAYFKIQSLRQEVRRLEDKLREKPQA